MEYKYGNVSPYKANSTAHLTDGFQKRLLIDSLSFKIGLQESPIIKDVEIIYRRTVSVFSAHG